MVLTLLLPTLCPPTAFAVTPSRWELKSGYGYQYTNNSRPNNYQVHVLLPSLVLPLAEAAGPSWFRGRLTWNPEFLLALFTHPNTRPMVGITPLQFRYELTPWGRWTPYLVAGAGVLWANIDRRETGARTNFNTQGGLGARFALTKAASLLLEYRHIHISNAGLDERNAGINTHTFLAGLSIEF